MTDGVTGFGIGDWCWHSRHASPCRVVDRQNLWGELAYRIWLPNKDAVVRARPQDLADLSSVQPTVEQILHTTGLILRELKLRGMVQRVLVVAPKGLVRQWQAEMRLHFGESFRFIEPSEITAFRQWRDE